MLELHPCSGAREPLSDSHICAPSNEALHIPAYCVSSQTSNPISMSSSKLPSVVPLATWFPTVPDDSSSDIRLSRLRGVKFHQ